MRISGISERLGCQYTGLMSKLIIGAAAVLALFAPAARPQVTAIACGQLIDGRSDVPSAGAVVVVEGQRITAVGSREIVPEGAQIIDLGSSTCLPGLIDAHAHPLIATDDYQVDHLRRSSAYKAIRGLKVLQDMLDAGWTTIRIAGDADVHYAHLDVKTAIDEGLVVGPRITGAGHYISITGGGGDVNFLSAEHSLTADGLVVDGVDEIRKAVRREVKYGSDWIKVLATGAFMTAGDNPMQVHFSPEELRALVEEADRLGVPVMAHAHSTAGIKQAVLAGVRSIEHGTFLDEEGIELMKERDTFLVPTLYVGEYFLEDQGDSQALSKAVELTRKYRGEYFQRATAAVAAGVKIGVGTDFVGFPVGNMAREIALLTQVGMTPMQAIQAATKTNAELLGWDERIGTLEAGKLADLIAVAGSPLTDLSALERVSFVMLGGRVMRAD